MEDVNFPLDQGQVTSALRGLRETTGERAAEEEFRTKNEPALETPAQTIDPVEEPDQPLEDAVDNNPLRGPRPSELRDESDATAFETERGQNISNLI